MEREAWQDILLPQPYADHVFELFHENSKIGRYHQAPSREEVLGRMKALHESLPFEGYPVVELPGAVMEPQLSLGQAMKARVSVREMTPCSLPFESVATLLHYAYGVTRESAGTSYPRSLRIVPSGGALYPLEILFHSAHTDGLKAGLFHYNPARNRLACLREGDETSRIAEAMVQPGFALNASAVFFITAVFERSVFKYGDRGYRFILLEAGHVAQNMNLISQALGLGCLNIGGFFDREIDDFLGLDGITHSTVYMIAVGKPRKMEPA